MKMNQIAEMLNGIIPEILGQETLVNEDLSNIVDIGTALENAERGLDNYVRRLVDHIGRVIVVNRTYSGRVPSLLVDGWEFGAVLEKIRIDLPEAQENQSWQLEHGASYDTNVFYRPEVNAKFYSNRTTFEVRMSFVERQVKSAFANAVQMNAFISAIETEIRNAITVQTDALVMRTINAGIAETLHNEFPGNSYANASGVRAVNLLHLYNQTVPEADRVTAASAIYSPEFIRFASYTIKNYIKRMQSMSTLFNVGGTHKFTPADRQVFVMLDEFVNAAEVYLYDGTNQFNTGNLRLPANVETVPFWQGSGIDYGFDSTSAINVQTPSGDSVIASGILGVLFDRDAMMVTNVDPRVTSHYNEAAEFWTEWHKRDAQYILDLDENIVVFYVA